jgi:predicted enzyme related to lactoylglutathione lyase
MTRLPQPSAVIFVADVRRMTRFYETVAAMTLLHQDEQHAVLELAGFELVIHALSGEANPGTPPRVRHDSYIKVCLPVENIALVRSKAATLGGGLLPPEDEWEGRGFRACDGHDPEGNVLQVRQALARN